MRLMPILYCTLALGLLAVPAAGTNDFYDRDALAALLTLDEQAPLADAEEELDRVTGLRDEAQMALDAAEAEQMAADAAVMASMQRVMDADQAVSDAETALAMATTPEEVEAANLLLEEAKAEQMAANEQLAMDQARALAAEGAVDTAQMNLDEAQGVVDAAQAVVDAIVAEIEGTEAFVAGLSEDDVFALNRALNNAVHTDLLPLDIDLALLEQLAEGGLTNREVQLATNAFEAQARFDRLADRFEAKAEASGKEQFLAKADRARAKGAAMKDKFLGKLAGDAAGEAAHAAASEHARNAAGEAARELAHDAVRDVPGQVARELAKQNGKPGA